MKFLEAMIMNPLELLALVAMRLVRRFRLDRLLRIGTSTYSFTDYFKGLEEASAVKRIFGEKTEEVLRNLRVEFTWVRSYMWVSDVDGHLTVSSYYLNNGDKVDIYLDLVHELVHVRQFMEGKQLFDVDYDYADRPTEVEAYRVAVEEARKMGLSDKRICRYLKTEWMSEADFKRLAKMLNVKC
jgi:hypothetical protein